MAEQKPDARAPEGEEPRRTPATDPTNPYSQESTGEWTAAEQASERRVEEPGLTDKERQRRSPTH